jgi:hypothetical protein
VNGARVGFVIRGLTATEDLEVFAGSVLLGVELGCVFHNHPALLAPTETEKATAARRAIPTTSSGADLLNFLLGEVMRILRVRWINPGTFSLRGI